MALASEQLVGRTAEIGVLTRPRPDGSQLQVPVDCRDLRADPTAVMIQDGPEPWDAVVREVNGDERAQWWERAVAAYPPYAEYQERTSRTIPVFVASRA